MKSYLSLAWKELKAQKVTSVLILLAVILSTIATTAVGQSIGILQSMRIEQAAGLNGDRYASFHQLTKEQSDILHGDSRLKNVGSHITVGTTELENSSLTLFLREYYGDALKIYPYVGQIKEGRLPESQGEIALSEDALKHMGIEGKIGDKITLSLDINLLIDDQPSYEFTADFILTGILESNYLGYATGMMEGIVGEGTAQSLLPERYMSYSTDFKTVSTKEFQSVVDDLTKKLNIVERQVQYNWILLDALGIEYPDKEGTMDANVGFPFMMAACVMVGVLILLAAGLVIYNILKVTVMKRIREYGTLRAIGGESRQLYTLVTTQIMLICVIGLPLGILLGVLSAKGILIAATGLLNPDLFMADSTQQLNDMIAGSGTGGILPILLSVAVTLLFAVLAAYPSAVYASRVSPTVAMSGQTVKVRRHSRRAKQIRHFEAFYARLNLKRSRGRTAITILSIVMSITVYVALQSFSGLLDASSGVQAMHTGDYCVTNEAVGITPEEVTRLKQHESVMELATSKLAVYSLDENGDIPVRLDFNLQSWETFQIAAIDEARIENYQVEDELTKEDREAIRRGEACLVVNPIPFSYEGQEVERTQFQRGDMIEVNGRKLRIAGTTYHPVSINNDGFTNGIQIIGTNELYDALTGESMYNEIYPLLNDDSDSEEFEKWLDEWCKDNPGTHWLSYRQSDEQMAESFEQIRLLSWGLILFIGLIGILNIINTVYTNIHTRVNEIGMQRAIGMSRGSLYKTFLWEGAYYGLIASGIGAVCGYICSIFVEAAANDSLQLSAVPLAAILEAAAVSVAACLIATAIPLRAIGKLSIVESIETVE
ncbi:MAG: FtsX-like permease family protein [Lachnospiraceae bacterium]|nr:FtsX-like permease family protein [Lachnospiraceae bacterium]